MKIAMVFDGLQIGGIERVGADYAKLLIELGYEVTVFNLVLYFISKYFKLFLIFE